MRDPLSRVPVRLKLPLLFVCVCLLAFGVGGYLVSGSARSALEHEILTRLDFQSRAYATALAARLRSLGKRTEDFASDGFIRDHTEALVANPTALGDGRLERELREHLIQNKLPLESAFVDLWVLDPTARVIASAREQAPARFPLGIHSDGLEGGLLYSELVPYGSERRPRLFLSTLLRSRTGGRPLGRLVAWVHPGVWIATALGGAGLESSRGQDPVRLELVDPMGARMGIDPSLTAPDAKALIGEILAHDFGTALVESQATLAAREPASGGRSRAFSQSYPVAESRWAVRVDLVPRHALAPVGGLQNRFLGVGLALALLAGLLLFFPMRFLA